ncbi:hypothetical protein AB0M43_14570 [Longispora sp. NPDC051575]|uniref:hypothetical protein n=1 Tax=Longispora sp. NPDC051575 TaxID=3154943 RepID=UPI0034128421
MSVYGFGLGPVMDVCDHAMTSPRHFDRHGPVDGPAFILRRTAPGVLLSSGRDNRHWQPCIARPLDDIETAGDLPDLLLPLNAEFPMVINGISSADSIPLSAQVYIALNRDCHEMTIDTSGPEPAVAFVSQNPGTWPGPPPPRNTFMVVKEK